MTRFRWWRTRLTVDRDYLRENVRGVLWCLLFGVWIVAVAAFLAVWRGSNYGR